VTPPVALTIAGSDPSGGAGLQADLKTFAAFDVYGAAVVTWVTAQNTVGVRAAEAISVELVRAQIDAVCDDLAVGAVKTGMLGSAAIVEAVAERVAARRLRSLIVDPVMVATSGDALIDRAAIDALLVHLLPLALLVTPNRHEAAVLAGRDVDSAERRRDAARAIRDRGAAAVLIKGGHDAGPASDLLLDDQGFLELAAERIAGGPTHGSGCTLSAAIAAGLAAGQDLRGAVAAAKAYVHEAIGRALEVGHGARPLDHRVRPRRRHGSHEGGSR
jgi:hydroxymethylpyrimidine/phosphomethylpyrimidine kinase